MRPPAASAAYWDAEAEGYARLRRPSRVDRVTLARVPPLGDVLELGAGPGTFTRQALAHPARAAGGRFLVTDLSPRFCAMLAALPVELLRCDHRELALAPGSVTTAYAMATLHHLAAADAEALLEHLARWLRPGGRLALVEDWAFAPGDEAEARLLALRRALGTWEGAGETHPDEATWRARLERAGLRVTGRAQVVRPEALERYEVLPDAASRAHLAWLRAQRRRAAVPMTLLVAEAGVA